MNWNESRWNSSQNFLLLCLQDWRRLIDTSFAPTTRMRMWPSRQDWVAHEFIVGFSDPIIPIPCFLPLKSLYQKKVWAQTWSCCASLSCFNPCLQEHCLRRANHPGIVGKLSRLNRSLRTALWQKRRMISCSIASRLVHSGSHASPCLNILLWCFHDASSMILAVQCCSRTWFPQIWSKHLPFVATTWFFSNVVSAHFPRWSCMHLFETRYLQHF